MINLNEPFTFENSSNPWLMDKVDDSNVLIFNRKKYTVNINTQLADSRASSGAWDWDRGLH